MTFPRAVEQRIDVRERLDRRPRDGVEAPLVVADEPRTVWLASEHHISRVTRRRVLDPAAIEQVDVIAPQPPRARHQKAAWERTYPSKTESESSGAVGYTSCTRRVSLLRAQWTARTVPVSYESGGFRGRQREVTSAADPSHFAVADVMEGGGGGRDGTRARPFTGGYHTAGGSCRCWNPNLVPLENAEVFPPSLSLLLPLLWGWLGESPGAPSPSGSSLPPSLSLLSHPVSVSVSPRLYPSLSRWVTRPCCRSRRRPPLSRSRFSKAAHTIQTMRLHLSESWAVDLKPSR